MNLQTLSIILIIIILPITLILSAYTKVQIDTISLQTMYKTKLKDATYDAVVAFQINTVHNTYSTVSDSMRRDISAAIQTFMSNLATNLGMSGTDETNIKPYIPAIVFTLYDGYYIYSPSISHTQNGDDNQAEKTSYEHVLKPYIYYTARYVNESQGIDIVVNYSLDNYIVVTGYIGPNNYVTNSGYLINTDNIPKVEESEQLERRLPVTTITFTDNENKSFVRNVQEFDTGLADMIVTNKEGMEADRLTNGKWLRDTNLFRNPEQLSVNQGIAGNRTEVDKISITRELLQAELEKAKAGDSSAKGNILKKWYQPSYTAAGNITEEKFTEGDYSLGFYVEPSTSSYYIAADSAKQYYEKAKEFTDWVNDPNNGLAKIKASDAVKADGSHYEGFSDEYIFQISNQNDPEDEASIFNDHRRDVIKASIQDNLSQAIASYNENSESLGTLANFQMPILSEDEWDQVLNNVCLITFMQGIQVGTKVFNDYAIVTSTKNKEYVSPDSIYYINPEKEETDEVSYYHKLGCPYLDDTQKIVGYRNSDFDRMSYDVENKVSSITYEHDKITGIEYSERDKTYYYYMHPEYACYYCIVNSSAEFVDWRSNPNRLKAYYTAMAREKFNFYKTNSYFEIND